MRNLTAEGNPDFFQTFRLLISKGWQANEDENV